MGRRLRQCLTTKALSEWALLEGAMVVEPAAPSEKLGPVAETGAGMGKCNHQISLF